MSSIKLLYPHVREKSSHSRNVFMVDIANARIQTDIRNSDSEKYFKKNNTAYALLPPFTTSVGPSQIVGTV